MPVYRVYYIGASGHFTGVEEIDCESEQEAVEKARQFAAAADVELWARGRLIARISSNDQTLKT